MLECTNTITSNNSSWLFLLAAAVVAAVAAATFYLIAYNAVVCKMYANMSVSHHAKTTLSKRYKAQLSELKTLAEHLF